MHTWGPLRPRSGGAAVALRSRPVRARPAQPWSGPPWPAISWSSIPTTDMSARHLRGPRSAQGPQTRRRRVRRTRRSTAVGSSGPGRAARAIAAAPPVEPVRARRRPGRSSSSEPRSRDGALRSQPLPSAGRAGELEARVGGLRLVISPIRSCPRWSRWLIALPAASDSSMPTDGDPGICVPTLTRGMSNARSARVCSSVSGIASVRMPATRAPSGSFSKKASRTSGLPKW